MVNILSCFHGTRKFYTMYPYIKEKEEGKNLKNAKDMVMLM